MGLWTVAAMQGVEPFTFWRASMIRDYKKIIAWQRAHELTLNVYLVTKAFPTDERYGMTSQARRAAYSVPANLAEGSGRDGNRDYLRFLYIALASLKETEYFLLLAHDLGYISSEQFSETTQMVNSSFGVLQGLIKAVKKETGPFGRLSAFIISSAILTLGKLSVLPS